MFGRDSGHVAGLFKRLLTSTGRLLAPEMETCVYCGKHATQRSGGNLLNLCLTCEEQIPWIRDARCAVCGRDEHCYDCRRRADTYFVCNRSAVRYDAMMKAWLARYKYRGDERLSMLMTGMLLHAYRQLVHEQKLSQNATQCITYIPLSEERLQERGFNQAAHLAQGLASRFQLPVVSLLTRTRHTDKQSYKTRVERLRDLQGAFAFDEDGWVQTKQLIHQLAQAKDGSQGQVGVGVGVKVRSKFMVRAKANPIAEVKPLEIILVDDVYTTGSTINECAKIITAKLDASVFGLTWAR